MREQLPDHMRFDASNRQYLVLAGVGAFFVTLLTAMRELNHSGVTEEVNVWLTVLFSIITLIGAGAALFRRSWLRLDREGFESSELRGLGKVAWEDVSAVRVYAQKMRGLPAGQQVAFKLTGEKQKVMSRLSGLMYHGTVRLTQDYRIKGHELAETMNAFRARALGDREKAQARS